MDMKRETEIIKIENAIGRYLTVNELLEITGRMFDALCNTGDTKKEVEKIISEFRTRKAITRRNQDDTYKVFAKRLGIPYEIFHGEWRGVFIGKVEILMDGKCVPMYRFPGGENGGNKCIRVDDFEKERVKMMEEGLL